MQKPKSGDLRSNFSDAYHDTYLTDTRVTSYIFIYCNDGSYFRNTYEQSSCSCLYVGSCPHQYYWLYDWCLLKCADNIVNWRNQNLRMNPCRDRRVCTWWRCLRSVPLCPRWPVSLAFSGTLTRQLQTKRTEDGHMLHSPLCKVPRS